MTNEERANLEASVQSCKDAKRLLLGFVPGSVPDTQVEIAVSLPDGSSKAGPIFVAELTDRERQMLARMMTRTLRQFDLLLR